MFYNLSKYWVSLLSILTLLLFFLIGYITPSLWTNETFKSLFLKIGFYSCPFLCVLWLITNFKNIFKDKDYLRYLIVCIGVVLVFVWTYKFKITYRMALLLPILCIVYSFIYRKWKKPDKVMIVFFLLMGMRFLSFFWVDNRAFFWQDINSNLFILLLIAPIACIGFRAKEEDCSAFVTLSFKLFLFLLTFNVCLYLLVSNNLENSLFSFLTFNKNYMPFYEILSWTTFKHPSFIAWIMLVIWGMGVLEWRKDNRKITFLEVVLYGILLLSFAFMVQARVVIVGVPLSIFTLIWFYITKEWSIKKRVFIDALVLLSGILTIYLLVTYTNYFSDPQREVMFKEAFENIKQHPIIGNGSSFQRIISKKIGFFHIHNDFLAIFIDLGSIGLSLLIFWLLAIYQKGLYYKDNSIIFTIAVFLLLMNTDVILNYRIGTYILLPFLILVFFKEEKTT